MTPSNFKTVGHFFNGFYMSFTERDDCLLKKKPRYIVVSPVHPTVCHVLLSQTALASYKAAN